jgi:beta propeller repeat protein
MGGSGKGEFHMVWLILLILVFFIVSPATAAGTETHITTHNNGMDHRLPKLYGDQVVWQDSISGTNVGIINLYNFTSGVETQITDNTSHATNPAIYADLIAYTDCGANITCANHPSTIYLYNITTGTRTQISSGTSWQDYPAIYGNRIVWQDYNQFSSSQIYLNGTSPGLAVQIKPSGSYQLNPSIYGDLVAYLDCGGDYTCGTLPTTIYLYDIVHGTTTQISSGLGYEASPSIFNNRIVWQDTEDFANYAVLINGTAPGEEYSLSPNAIGLMPQYPTIYGNWVVWTQTNSSGSNYDIIVNETSSNSIIPIALDRSGVDFASISFAPADSFFRIVWDEQDASGYNVYLYTNGTPVTCPVASFTNDFTGGSAPVTVDFTDTSNPGSNPITHWFWDFGDGHNSTLAHPSHPYSANGAYDVSLTVSNPNCRDTTTVTDSDVIGTLEANFTASSTSVMAPATITFNDTSLGYPTQWNWNFGDGTSSAYQNPTHLYTTPGLYTVSLTVSSGFAAPDTITRTSYITVLGGVNEFANTTVNGITIQDTSGRQFLIFDRTTLTDWTFYPNTSVLKFTPPPDRGFQNISIFTTDPGGFAVSGNTIIGNISSVSLQTKNILLPNLSVSTGGPLSSVNYSIDLPSYPVNGILNTLIWEGATASDATIFSTIATRNKFSGMNGTALTIKIIRTNFPDGGSARLHMSLNATLVNSKPSGSNELFIERIVDGGLSGEMLGTRYLYYNSTENLDYFEADSPHGLSTFGVSFLEGAGNLFQLISLTVSSFVQNSNSGSSGQSSSGSGSYTTIVPTVTFTPVAPQPTASLSPAYSVRTTGQGTSPANEPPGVVPAPESPAPSAMNTFLGIVSRHVYLFAAAVVAVISLLYIRQRRQRFDPLG